MPQSHHTSGPVRAVSGLFPGCFEQKSYVHSRGLYGPRAAPHEFCLSVRSRRVLMHAVRPHATPLRDFRKFPYMPGRDPHGPCTGTVGYEKH